MSLAKWNLIGDFWNINSRKYGNDFVFQQRTCNNTQTNDCNLQNTQNPVNEFSNQNNFRSDNKSRDTDCEIKRRSNNSDDSSSFSGYNQPAQKQLKNNLFSSCNNLSNDQQQEQNTSTDCNNQVFESDSYKACQNSTKVSNTSTKKQQSNNKHSQKLISTDCKQNSGINSNSSSCQEVTLQTQILTNQDKNQNQQTCDSVNSKSENRYNSQRNNITILTQCNSNDYNQTVYTNSQTQNNLNNCQSNIYGSDQQKLQSQILTNLEKLASDLLQTLQHLTQTTALTSQQFQQLQNQLQDILNHTNIEDDEELAKKLEDILNELDKILRQLAIQYETQTLLNYEDNIKDKISTENIKHSVGERKEATDFLQSKLQTYLEQLQKKHEELLRFKTATISKTQEIEDYDLKLLKSGESFNKQTLQKILNLRLNHIYLVDDLKLDEIPESKGEFNRDSFYYVYNVEYTTRKLERAFIQLLERISENPFSRRYNEEKYWDIKKIMLRRFTLTPVHRCKSAFGRDEVVVALDFSGSCEFIAKFYRELAEIANKFTLVRVIDASNGFTIDGYNTALDDGDDLHWEELKKKKVLFFGDFDGAVSIIKLSHYTDVVWLSCETRYKDISEHDWGEGYTLRDFKGKYFMCLDKADIVKIAQKF